MSVQVHLLATQGARRGTFVQGNVRATQKPSKGRARAMKRYKNNKTKAEKEEQGQEEAGVRVGVRRAYKKKADRVCLVNVSQGGQAVDGNPNWKKKRVKAEKRAGKPVSRGLYDHILIPRLSDKPCGFRLTHEWVQATDIGDTLRERVRELLVEMLYNSEAALAFHITEIGLFSSNIEPTHVIRTILHDACQETPFKTPRALEDEVIDIINVRWEAEIVESARSQPCNP